MSLFVTGVDGFVRGRFLDRVVGRRGMSGGVEGGAGGMGGAVAVELIELFRASLPLMTESPKGGVDKLAFLNLSPESRAGPGIITSKVPKVDFLDCSRRCRSRSRRISTSIRHSTAFLTSSRA